MNEHYKTPESESFVNNQITDICSLNEGAINSFQEEVHTVYTLLVLSISWYYLPGGSDEADWYLRRNKGTLLRRRSDRAPFQPPRR